MLPGSAKRRSLREGRRGGSLAAARRVPLQTGHTATQGHGSSPRASEPMPHIAPPVRAASTRATALPQAPTLMYRPVNDASFSATCSGVPVATTRRPRHLLRARGR